MPTIAVIDADAGERRVLHMLLGAMNVDARLFETAEDFLAQSIGGLVCVIASVWLPGKSGLELLEQLRATGSDLPVILLSSESDIRTAVEAMRLGATDFIEKPQMDIALLRRISELLHDRAAAATSSA